MDNAVEVQISNKRCNPSSSDIEMNILLHYIKPCATFNITTCNLITLITKDQAQGFYLLRDVSHLTPDPILIIFNDLPRF